MVFKVYYGHVLGRPADDLLDSSETSKVLLNHVLLVEVWRNIPAHDGDAVGGRHATQTIRALPAYATFSRGWGFKFLIWRFCCIWRAKTGKQTRHNLLVREMYRHLLCFDPWIFSAAPQQISFKVFFDT